MRLQTLFNRKTRLSLASVSPWASTNKLLHFGSIYNCTFIVNVEYHRSFIDVGNYSLRIKYEGEYPINRNTILRSFITGFESSHIGIKVTNSFLDQDIVFNVTVSHPTFKLLKIWINFVIFNMNNN